MKATELRKNKSIEILKQKGIPFLNSLPEIEDKNRALHRNTKEVGFRALALAIIAVKAEGLEKEVVDKLIDVYDVVDKFTTKEKEFINAWNPDNVTATQFLWRYEAYWVLLWALGFVKELNYPSKICDVPQAVSFFSTSSLEQFLKSSKLRNINEILDQADLIYRYHWAIVSARIKGENPPAGLDRGVVYERHYALNWLIGHCGVSDWDDTLTDT